MPNEERDDLAGCISPTRHYYVSPSKERLLARFTGLENKIREIRAAAERGDYAAILKALDDVECGHSSDA